MPPRSVVRSTERCRRLPDTARMPTRARLMKWIHAWRFIMADNILVVPTERNGWVVEVEGTDGATSHYPSQEEAIAAAREKARQDRVELIIYGPDGQIQERDDFR